MEWGLLILAGIFEMLGVIMINYLHEKRNISSLLLLLISFGASFFLLAIVMEVLPMGVTYAVWTGIGVVGSTLCNILFFGESMNWQRLSFIMLILFTVIGLKFTV
ncbi:DMT family transporter [Salirhabdus salicampi]|uniref:DMT family transporter n=1 Tax=Salirhabdus salicampi TaxID=476102 RepID=UPI0020C4B8E4|nr:multidrug efflux SMR transporter [Salirhabdus salicampi]MCP8615433.1 multidrug efflux SMR transporter [Salirhabdus salicampi]